MSLRSFLSQLFFHRRSEERLGKLEKELKAPKQFHKEEVDIFRMVERREALWVQFRAFEKRLAVPACLNNRDGRLFGEVKECKPLETELPQVCTLNLARFMTALKGH